MADTKKYLQALFDAKKVIIPENRINLFEEFASNEENDALINRIIATQDMLTDKWNIKSRLADIQQQQVMIPNGTIGKPYIAVISKAKLGWDDMLHTELSGLEDTGLSYGPDTETISGTPVVSGEVKIIYKFKLAGQQEDASLNEKIITLTINPDPKSLWKNKPGNKEDPYWKEENVAEAGVLGTKHIVVASKRGRSHANVGSYRDDDYAYKYYEATGWGVVVVADGAGSASLSRKGSQLACASILKFFNDYFSPAVVTDFDEVITAFKITGGDENQKKLSRLVYDCLSKAAWGVHQELTTFAKDSECNLKDLHTTLIFTLFKKYDFGYALLSFGVGDCPIALINKELTEVTLLNWLDVGEYGGGTRFITMPEIFTSDKFATRFKFKMADDFAYLMLMTDGIYDPKFVVEANLEKTEKWLAFIEDLKGENEDGIKVEFVETNNDIAQQLSQWMDFWSPGNHDDRTLAIVY